MLAPIQEIENKSVIGSFYERDFGKCFEYSANNTGMYSSFPHIVYVLDGFRFATVFKTVAYIATDEHDEHGLACEKWAIKDHNIYTYR